MILKLLFFFTAITVAFSRNFYRRDYTYDCEHDAFYKLIWSPTTVSFDAATVTCDEEGSQLFYPKDKDEWKLIKTLVQTLPQKPNTTDVLIGIYHMNGQYITVDGHATNLDIKEQPQNTGCVTMDLDTGDLSACQEHTFPKLFVCKKTHDTDCPTIDSSYKFVREMNKCYKEHRKQKPWDDAMHECYLEGGHLVVIENDEEAKILLNLGALEAHTIYHAGFRKLNGSEALYTLKGKQLDKSYRKNYLTSPPPRSPINHQDESGHRTNEEKESSLPSVEKNCGALMHHNISNCLSYVTNFTEKLSIAVSLDLSFAK